MLRKSNAKAIKRRLLKSFASSIEFLDEGFSIIIAFLSWQTGKNNHFK